MIDIFRPSHGQEGDVELVMRQVVQLDYGPDIPLSSEQEKEKESLEEEEEEEEEEADNTLVSTQDLVDIFLW